MIKYYTIVIQFCYGFLCVWLDSVFWFGLSLTSKFVERKRMIY